MECGKKPCGFHAVGIIWLRNITHSELTALAMLSIKLKVVFYKCLTKLFYPVNILMNEFLKLCLCRKYFSGKKIRYYIGDSLSWPLPAFHDYWILSSCCIPVDSLYSDFLCFPPLGNQTALKSRILLEWRVKREGLFWEPLLVRIIIGSFAQWELIFLWMLVFFVMTFYFISTWMLM